MNDRAIPLWLSIAFCTYAATALATPTITVVSGGLADGETVTISGAGFGSGPHVQIFDDFESGHGEVGKTIPLTSPQVGEWSSYTTGGRPNYSSFARSGTHGFRISDPANMANWGKRVASFTKLLPSPATEVFISYAIFVPPGTTFSGASVPGVLPPLSTWKGLWLFDGPDGFGGNGKSDVVLPTWASFWAVAGNSGGIIDEGFGDWFSFKSWNRFSIWLKANPASPVMKPGTIYVQTASPEKGHAERTYTDRSPFQGPTSHNNPPSSGKWDRFTFPGWFGNGVQTDNQMTYDDIYVAIGPNSAARVEIGDAPTYKESRNLAISTPQTWSDGKIVFTLRAGPFADLSKAYLYVIDAKNQVSSGFPLRQQTVPTAPGAVMVR